MEISISTPWNKLENTMNIKQHYWIKTAPSALPSPNRRNLMQFLSFYFLEFLMLLLARSTVAHEK